MASLLDAFQYPWGNREAQELHVTLTTLYPSDDGALYIAETAGLRRFELPQNQPALFLWRAILTSGAAKGRNRRIVELALEHNPTSPRAPLLQSLLVGRPAVMDLQPRNSDGSASFLSGDDRISAPEALLFHDDVSLPIGRIPRLIATLELMVRLAAGVCRLRVTAAGITGYGTGFRVGSDALLTNHHVLFPDGMAPTHVRAEFDYETDAEDNERSSRTVACDVSSIVFDEGDDWAIVRAEGLDPEWPVFDLAASVAPARGIASYIIQHPNGERKRLAFIRNTVTEVQERTFYYLTDTAGGSSGSPVLDQDGRLIGLHRAGGIPQTALGRAPIAKNEGICIPRVKSALDRYGVVL